MADINADELHNLKRKQLQSLCKKNGIKANGKNEELIEMLLEHAQDGPVDTASGDESVPEEANGEEEGPEKVFKVVPDTGAKELSMEAPESMERVSREQFPSLAEKVTAEMEARTAALAADQRKEVVKEYKAAHNIDTDTPSDSNEAARFDKAHDKIFGDDDSIANHWAANKTPRKKRINDSGEVPASNKRPRLEPLFSSPAVTRPPIQSPDQRRKSVKSKAMTAKARRTAAAMTSSVTDGYKTVAAAGTRTKASGKAGLLGTQLFAGAGGSSKSIEDSASTTEPQAKEPTFDSKELVEAEKPVGPAKTVQATDTASKPSACLKDTAQALSKQAKDATEHSGCSAKAAASASTTSTKSDQATAKPALAEGPTRIPTSRTIAKPTAATAAAQRPKAPADKKAKPDKTSAIPRPIATATSKRSLTSGAPKPVPKHKPANYRNVESKVKSYINAKPANKPVDKPTKSADKPADKPTGKPANAANKQQTKPVVSRPPPATKKAQADGDVPSYMRSTKATEIRSHKPGQAKDKKVTGGPASPTAKAGGKGRFNPYGRPTKLAPAKPSAAK
ncbi:hypothetical protein GGF46_003486 [Coemansia sp. RSA 552]|nr:hypothetical protein GGF46_003486 [Coemansia sp. RSA 552]